MTSPRSIQRSSLRSAARALTDAQLIDSMRNGSAEAWQEFMMRFGPLLEHYGRRMGMPRTEWSACTMTVLEDAAMRWAVDGDPLPRNMTAYLLRAVSFQRLTLLRTAKRRAYHQEVAARTAHPEGVIVSIVSEASVRDSRDPLSTSDENVTRALRRFCALLCEPLSDAERALLSRLGDGLPHREIAALFGLSYETARKRIQRLCARVRASVPLALERMNPSDRYEAERLLKRLRPARPKRGGDDVV